MVLLKGLARHLLAENKAVGQTWAHRGNRETLLVNNKTIQKMNLWSPKSFFWYPKRISWKKERPIHLWSPVGFFFHPMVSEEISCDEVRSLHLCQCEMQAETFVGSWILLTPSRLSNFLLVGFPSKKI